MSVGLKSHIPASGPKPPADHDFPLLHGRRPRYNLPELRIQSLSHTSHKNILCACGITEKISDTVRKIQTILEDENIP